jgi:hypothetical protein
LRVAGREIFIAKMKRESSHGRAEFFTKTGGVRLLLPNQESSHP